MNDSYKGVYCYTTDKLIGIIVQSCETKNLTQNKFVSSETYSKLSWVLLGDSVTHAHL